MTREEAIDVAATHYDYGYSVDSRVSAYCCFRDGAEWADNNPKSLWISVKEDLPCNHEELIVGNLWTRETVVFNGNDYYFDRMSLIEGKWCWECNRRAKFWLLIPKVPKE